MKVCYYPTGHGLGHAVRSAQVIEALPADVPVIIRTTVPEWLFQSEVTRPFRYIRAEFDCGCMQKDSFWCLERETLDRYRDISRRNREGLADEVAFLRRENVTCVVSDIPSFPLYAAAEAGIPGLAITNFTWHEIYGPFVRTAEDSALVDTIAAEYSRATLALILPLDTANASRVFPTFEHIPLVTRRGHSIRERIEGRVGRGRRIALMYFGLWGLTLDWSALQGLSDWVFLTFDFPSTVPNVVTLDRTEWPVADVAASVDAVVTKPGYGTVSECIANDIPLVYVPRPNFAECGALIAGMQPWGGGFPLTIEQFERADWVGALEDAVGSKRNPAWYGTNGAQVAADIILRYAS